MAGKLALTKRSQYLAVYKAGKAFVTDLLVLKVIPNNLDITRVGYSVTKEIGKATVRNHIKRLLKEIIRVLEIKNGWDIVFIARKRITEADYHKLDEVVTGLLKRADLLK